MFERASGLLLPIASLPKGGADDFLRFLEAAGQRWWQMLPVGPGISPYSSISAFAGDEAIFGEGPVEDRPIAPWLKQYAAFRARKGRGDERAWIERQWRFDDCWAAFKKRANDAGVSLMGDLPLFVAAGSADVAAHPKLFDTTRVAGVPPDYFNADGQLWGNPQYDWAAHKRTKFRWWKERVDRQFELFDAVRIDHFLGLHRAWSIPAGAESAAEGEWRPVPGDALLKALGPRKFIAENLGIVTDEAEALRKKHGLPGMHVLHFSFGGHRPFWFESDNVVYTGTHDNDTTKGWSSEPDAQNAMRYLGCTRAELPGKLLRLAWLSRPDLAIAPVQDVLGLGTRARMNTPGTIEGNWKWKLRRGQLTKKHARELRALTRDAAR